MERVLMSSRSTRFQFEANTQKARAEYEVKRPLYEAFCSEIERILTLALRGEAVKYVSVQKRAKDIDSFANKVDTPAEDDPSKPKYQSPVDDIHDLAGVRVIAYFLKDLTKVDRIISDEFEVIHRTDKGEQLAVEEKLGYQSVHYIVSLTPERTALTEYSRYAGLVAEIQVRTVLQHAWAEIAHDIQYKVIETIPSSIGRRFMQLAGTLEMCDREFQSIHDDDEHLRAEARKSVQQGNLKNVEITGDALKAYLDNKFGQDARLSTSSYEQEAQTLLKMGFVDFQQIDQCIGANVSHVDELSKKVWGARQGQIKQFETLLIAGMGDNYSCRHPMNGKQWFVESTAYARKKLQEAGVLFGHYNPSGK